MKLIPVSAGFLGTASNIEIRILPFLTTDSSCSTYYKVTSDDGSIIKDGNISLTNEEYNNWGSDNTYVENIVLSRLNLERDEEN